MLLVEYQNQMKLVEQYVRDWLIKRKLDASLITDLPQIGVMAYVNNKAVAAGFLRKVEGNVGLLDSLITDPDASGADRHVAIDSVVRDLIKQAVSMKMTRIIAYSVDEGTLKRSKTHGFVELDYTVIALNLGKAG